ncbi:MAG TPA: signal peptidase I [Dongiaceae bacterium]|nr:signal peptidase I [Dongiaceae bacterium]
MKAETKSEKKQVPQEKLTVQQKVRREAIAWFWVGLLFLLINGAIGQARVIPSGSMEDTLLIGDHLIMSRVGYDAGIPFTNLHISLWRNPKRQQIIIFKPPFDPAQPDYVKRAIGLPGDVVDIHDGSVWINGQRLAEDYTLGKTERIESASATPMPYKVPDNCYFAMGDNRQNSYDSRFWGCVPRQDIIGTPVLIYMSLNAPANAWQPGQIGERFLAYLNGILHPSTVRWRRLFHVF